MEPTTTTVTTVTITNLTTIFNLTPHAIVVGSRSFPPSGSLARVAMVVTPKGEIDGVPLFCTAFGQVEGLPPQEAGRYYLVSALVASAVKERTDLLSPSGLVRDGEGKVIGCEGFTRPA